MQERHPIGRARGSALAAFVALGVAAIVVSCGSDATRAPAGSAKPVEVITERSLIVRMKSAWGNAQIGIGGGERELRAMVAPDAEIEPIHGDLYRVAVPEGTDPSETVRRLRGSGNVEHVERDYVVQHFGRLNDPQVAQQWAHAVVNSEAAWDLGMGSHDVTVAVVDTGIDPQHPDLAANLWRNTREVPGNGRDDDGNGYVDDVHGYDFANRDGNPAADDAPHYHGTHVAGTVGAVGDNGVGISGHAPKVRLMALKFLTASGGGQVSHAIQAIYYAIANGAKIISNSWGGPQNSTELARAIDEARKAGVLFVVAAGNGGTDGIGDNNDSTPTYPAAYKYDNMVTVAATDRSDNLTRFSNYGPKTVHVGAPGEGIWSTMNGGNYQSMSGTSMATPLVSGVLALMIAKRPDLGYQAIRKALFDSVDAVPGLRGRVGSNGRVNAYRAMAALGGGTPTPTPTASPTPTPTPTSTPTPSPTPSPSPTAPAGIAPQPLLAGMTSVRVRNPYLTIPIDYDVSAFAGAAGAYVEVSRPGANFSNPNGDSADPARQTYASMRGARNRVLLTPSGMLPGWGIYQIRVIPLNASGAAAGRFSNASVLDLRP